VESTFSFAKKRLRTGRETNGSGDQNPEEQRRREGRKEEGRDKRRLALTKEEESLYVRSARISRTGKKYVLLTIYI